MKKIDLLILAILFIPIISAVNVDIKTEFDQGETLTAIVSGNFLNPISNYNVFLYRDYTRVPLEPHVAKIGDDFYIYGKLTGKQPDNYSLVIENVKYQEGLNVIEDDIIQYFLITNNSADFSIDKGFVVTNKDFYIEVQNLNSNKITIKTEISGSELISLNEEADSEITLNSGNTKKINFNVNPVKDSDTGAITFSSGNLTYLVIISLFEGEPSGSPFRFEPSELNITLATGSSSDYIIYLYNFGNEPLEDISITVSDSLSPFISLSKNSLTSLEGDSKQKIEISIKKRNDEISTEGQITAKTSDNFYAYASIFLNFLEDFIPSEDITSLPESSQTCENLNGQMCAPDETCTKNFVYALDGKCCLGSCTTEKTSPVGSIIGWILIIVVLGLVIVIGKKYKKTKKPFNLLKFAKGKIKKQSGDTPNNAAPKQKKKIFSFLKKKPNKEK